MAEKNRQISSAVATAVGLGAIIGAGIYVLSGTAIALAGAYAIFAFLFVGVLAVIISLELGELGSLLPNVKGAAYSYTYKALGSEMGFVSGILGYMAYSTSIGAIALGFGSYLSSLLGVPLTVYAIPSAIALIVVLSIVNMFGVRKAAKADFWLVLIKIGVLILFVLFAVYVAFSNPQIGLSNVTFTFQGNILQGIFAASVAVFFAYSGFQSISSLTERIEGGSKGYVKAILSAVVISIILYVLVVAAMLILAPASQYKIAADPLSYALSAVHAPSWLFVVVDIGALIATTSAILAMILTSSRYLYQISDDKLLPKYFRKYNSKTDVAQNGILISALIGIVVLFAGNIYIIAAISNFGLLFNYLIVGLDVMHFRRNKFNSPFKMPLYPYLPVIGMIFIFIMLAGMPNEALVIGSVMIMLLIAVYYVLREAEMKKVIRIHLFK